MISSPGSEHVPVHPGSWIVIIRDNPLLHGPISHQMSSTQGSWLEEVTGSHSHHFVREICEPTCRHPRIILEDLPCKMQLCVQSQNDREHEYEHPTLRWLNYFIKGRSAPTDINTCKSCSFPSSLATPALTCHRMIYPRGQVSRLWDLRVSYMDCGMDYINILGPCSKTLD